MILITSTYLETNPSRQDEYLRCLQRNLENEYLDEIHLFLEDQSCTEEWITKSPLFASSKLHLIPWKGRSRYSDLIDYANLHLPNGAKAIISNADIYFDQTLMLLEDYDLTAKLLCLSRWNVEADGSSTFFEHPGSQDAWIFQTPLRKLFCDFPMGVPGCDNRLAWEAEQAGLTISNPSRSIHIHHLHLSQVHHYTERQRITGPTRAVPAIFLEADRRGLPSPDPNVPLAEVAFSESMGYTVSRLERGTSSHNNESRPFTNIPVEITGFLFTQVVAYAVSPIEIQFITSGKLFILVGNDWDGYVQATEWMGQNGVRENLKLLETQYSIGFEVWSLTAEAGQRFIIPTQVMLVSTHLTKVDFTARHHFRQSEAHHLAQEDRIIALTSLAPNANNLSLIQGCLQSWRDAGLEIISFNHPDEIKMLANHYDVQFVPVTKTAEPIFGRHFIPINSILDWAGQHDITALVINSDIHLRMSRWELERIRWLSHGGLCYFVRYNHHGNFRQAHIEPYGMDAFLTQGRHVTHFPSSFLCMGQPFWDYLVPCYFAAHGYPIHAVEFPSAFHRIHPSGWSWDNWHQCALEFSRTIGQPLSDQSIAAYMGFAGSVRYNINQQRITIRQSSFSIREWVQKKFNYRGRKEFLELGAYCGDDTTWMAKIPDVNIHAFEPDPRNNQIPPSNVTLHRSAIADHDGFAPFHLSEQGWGQQWTHSSSLKRPKKHLSRYPVTFGGEISVPTTTLDRFCQQQGLDIIDFVWADIQGAEGDMIRGGRQTLARTRYLYTEYSNDELYENQISLQGILDSLPEFRILEIWEDDVLLENQNLKANQ
jgi:FkbM family methyltransferase